MIIVIRKMNISLLKIIVCVLFVSSISCENKYSRSSNEKKNKDVDFRKLEKPFRMNKLNILWSKAQHVSYTLFLNTTLKVSPRCGGGA